MTPSKKAASRSTTRTSSRATPKKDEATKEVAKGTSRRLSTADRNGKANVKKSAKGVGMSHVDVAPRAAVKSPAKSAPAKARVNAVVSSSRKPAKAARTRRVVHTELVASEIAQAMLGEMETFGDEDTALQRQAQRSQRERDLLSRLAVSMYRSDDMPNMELAAELVLEEDASAVSVLIGCIERHDYEHAPDAARVVCEVGMRAPHLLLEHAERLVCLCDESQKEVLPFTMYALSPVGDRFAVDLWEMRDLFWSALADLTQPTDMAQAGAVRLLSSLCAAGPDYARTLAGGLVDLLGKCQPKDVAFFAESVLPALGTAHSHRAKPVLDRRMKELAPAEVARLRRAVRAAQTGQPLYAAA